VLKRWERTLGLLREEPMELYRELDWVIKKWLLEQQMARRGLDWTAPRLSQLDIQYHNIDPSRSLFYLLQDSGQVERIIDDATIERYVTHPSDDTRAYTRASCLRKYPQSIWAVNWERLLFKFPDRRNGSLQYHNISLLNPLRGTRAEHEGLFSQAGTIEIFLEAINETQRGRH
jgi:proteasome accessory factor A